MYAEIAAALTSLKTFSELTALVLKTKVDSAVTEKAIESHSVLISVQQTLLTLQTQYQNLLQEKQSLEQRLMQMENWEAEARKYHLNEVAPGVFVYAPYPDPESPAPMHWLCANCYDQKQKSILQRAGKSVNKWVYGCARCNARVMVLAQ